MSKFLIIKYDNKNIVIIIKSLISFKTEEKLNYFMEDNLESRYLSYIVNQITMLKE